MGQADELGLSKTAVLKLARTKLNRVNEHTTLFTGTPIEPESDTEGKAEDNDGEPGEITSETVKSRSYYGDHVMGPAVRSEFHTKSFAAAISFCVKEDIDSLSESFVVTAWDINPPEVFLNTKEYIAFQADVKARSQTPSFSLGKEVPGKLFKPTDLQLYVKISLIVNAHPEVYLPLSEDKLTQLRDCLQTEFSWDINVDGLRKLLLSRLRFRSMGSVPVDAIDLASIEAKEREHQAAIALPTRKANGDKEKDVPWTEDEKKDYAAKQKLMRKRLTAPKPTLADRLNAAANFKQVEDTKAKIIFHEDPSDRSFMRIRVTHMYKDESRPQDQPSFKTDIDLTYRNTRRIKKGPKPETDRYDPSHRIINVSDQSFIPFLEKIFPDLAVKDKDYWKKCYASLQGGHDLVLLQFLQNKEPMTSNLFVDRDDIPTSYKDLQTIMRNAPCIFVLVRGTDIEEITESIIHRFSELAVFDPLSAFFVDKHNPYINNKGIKATPELPKFSTLPENSFEDWREFSIHCGVGAIIELRFNMQDHTHRGKASAHPVPHTQFKYKAENPDKSKPANETSLDLCLFPNFTEEHPNKEVPRLAIGDRVTVGFGDDHALSAEHKWSGRVVVPALSTGMDQVCMIINRPIDKDCHILDMAPYTELTAADMDNMSVEEIQQWSSDNRVLQVTVGKEGDDKECKRLCNGLSNMQVPNKLLPEYDSKEQVLSQFRLFMQCKDHTRYDVSSLYDTLLPADRHRFEPALLSSLHEYQKEPVSSWINSGIHSHLAVLGGISGSGKTFLSISTLCGYVFKVQIDPMKRQLQESELARLDTDTSGESGSKDATQNPAEPSEDGRVTHVCIQNETVDHCYQTFKKILPGLCKTMGVPEKLFIRLHSIQSERKALCAMLDVNRKDHSKHSHRYLQDEKLQGKANKALLDQYLREFRTEYVGVTDKRYKYVEGSLAWIILQLSRVEGFPVTKEVANTWNESERDVIATQLRDIPKAYRDITTEDKMSDQSRKDVKAAFRIGYHIVIERAAVVCTTLSVATKSSFQIYRKANAVTFEEAGRGTDLDVTALLSTHWACDLITLVGDWRQLGFTPYGPALDNPFQSQLTVSSFARLYYTGFPIQLLTHTSRFSNPTLLKLCAHLNGETISEVPGSFNTAKEEQAKEVNRKIWGKKSVVVVVNTEHAVATQESSGSWYSVVTAIATMHDMVNRLKTIDGDDVLVITPYNGQLRLLQTFRDTAVRNALAAHDKKLAKQLTKVMMITIDSSMGKDREHVIMDSVGNAEGFLWQRPRTLVAGTRARSSFIFIGPTFHYTHSAKGPKDRLKEMLYRWGKDGLIVTLDRISIASLEQYRDTQVALSVAIKEDAFKAPHNYRQAALGPELTEADYTDEEDSDTIVPGWNNVEEPTVNPKAGTVNIWNIVEPIVNPDADTVNIWNIGEPIFNPEAGTDNFENDADDTWNNKEPVVNPEAGTDNFENDADDTWNNKEPVVNPEAGTENFENDADDTWNNKEPVVNPKAGTDNFENNDKSDGPASPFVEEESDLEAGADNFEADDKSDGPASPFVEEKSDLGAEDEET
ncbi:hypothetical protein PTNB73_00937 [Pyrenophora teres f. teres]|nr:hypothetical protein HRS9122_02205 [Pyrenophora teres f. teres]KAE8874305.1 hypothetical protein PTNB73_00937 [Pyrenophora teres f. teres]